jgi:hypothetical protein
MWHPEAQAAFDEFKRRTEPSWRRRMDREDEQSKFEEAAIEKEARRLYHERLLGLDKGDVL